MKEIMNNISYHSLYGDMEEGNTYKKSPFVYLCLNIPPNNISIPTNESTCNISTMNSSIISSKDGIIESLKNFKYNKQCSICKRHTV